MNAIIAEPCARKLQARLLWERHKNKNQAIGIIGPQPPPNRSYASAEIDKEYQVTDAESEFYLTEHNNLIIHTIPGLQPLEAPQFH